MESVVFCIQNILTSPDPPESVERHISVWKIERRRKNKKSPKFVRYFSAVFSIFRNSWKIRKKNSSESVRAKIHAAENKGFYFLDVVRIRPCSSDSCEIEKMFFSNFFSHFLDIHFSWISTELDVLWCIGGPQKISMATPPLLKKQFLPENPPRKILT